MADGGREPDSSAPERDGGGNLDLSGLMRDGLRELIELVGASEITELRIERGGAKLHIKSAHPPARPLPVQFPHAPVEQALAPPTPSGPPQAAVDAAIDAATEALRHVPVTSPIVGTFYAAASPRDEPFVRVGERVEEGQTVGIVEAMKIMNEIESEVAGRVVEILVESGQAVEYGQQLLLVDTTDLAGV